MVALTWVVMGCASDIEIKERVDDRGVSSAPATAPPATLAPETAPPSTVPSATVPSATVPVAPGSAEAIEGCDRKTIGEESGPLAVAYSVQNGRLAPSPCFGEASAVVEAAWLELALIAPPQLIAGVTILAGFDDEDSDTLAFAGPVNDDSDDHLIAVGIVAAVDDPQELRLTMAHELAHVFTQTTDQIDVAFFADDCDTFFNGFGCFQQDAYMTAWIDQFWAPTDVASLPSDYSVDIEGGEQRCLVDPGFPGSYAASHPEEDLAESFSAYVFDVDMPVGFDDRLRFFDDYPEFVAMRQAIRRREGSEPSGNFDDCG